MGQWVGEGVDGCIGNEHKDDLFRLETLALRSLTATRKKTLDLGEHHVTLLRLPFAFSLIYLPGCIFLKPLRTGVTYAWDIKTTSLSHSTIAT